MWAGLLEEWDWIRQMKVKNTMSSTLALVRMADYESNSETSAAKMWRKRNIYTLLVGM